MSTAEFTELRGRRAVWRLEAPLPASVRSGIGAISPMLAHLLYCRGYRTEADIDTFFTGGPISHDPALLPDMHLAVERIARAVEAGESIAIYGDFDCDGLTATAILEGALRDLGASPVVHIPNRDDGHGLQPESLASLADAGVTLIVTGDCGIGAIDEVQAAHGFGMDVVITDHHEPRADGSRPDCPVVAPTSYQSSYPFRFLCGAGVAYKLAQALAARFPGRLDPDRYLDLVALGTVADVVPLRDENRTFVVRGLKALQRTTRPGLVALFQAAGVEAARIDPVSIGFYLAPRINAANRMASPQLAYDLISARDPAIARDLAQRLSTHNEERQRLVEQHGSALTALLGSATTLVEQVRRGDRAPILIARGQWQAGISGLLATRLVEIYGMPAFVGTDGADGTISVSGRGIPGVHIDKLLENAEASVPGGLYLGHGGHSGAGGFRVSADRWDLARETLETQARAMVAVDALGAVLRIDAEVPLFRLTLDAADRVRSLAPFGTGFEEPLFLARGVTVRSVSPVGNGKHARIALRQGTGTLKGIYFRADRAIFDLRPGSQIDAVFHLQVNEWNGYQSPQLQLRDWRPTPTQPSSPTE